MSCTSGVENCHNYHHTLLHIEGDPKIEGTKKVSMDMTYAAPLKQSEKVLLMTCRVEVMAPYTSKNLARWCSVDLAHYGTPR